MIKYLFFKLVDLLFIFSKKNFQILQKYTCTDGNVYIVYAYNSKRYIYIGAETGFPPPIKPGFNPCIIEATTDDGKDVTELVKKCAGPKHDFYGVPNVGIMLGKFTMKLMTAFEYGRVRLTLVPVIRPVVEKTISVKNIFNQTRELGRT